MPASFVVRFVVTPVSVLTMVTVAPGITAPEESVTVPRRSLEFVLCAKPATAMHKKTAATDRVRNAVADQGLMAVTCSRRASQRLVLGVFLIVFPSSYWRASSSRDSNCPFSPGLENPPWQITLLWHGG